MLIFEQQAGKASIALVIPRYFPAIHSNVYQQEMATLTCLLPPSLPSSRTFYTKRQRQQCVRNMKWNDYIMVVLLLRNTETPVAREEEEG